MFDSAMFSLFKHLLIMRICHPLGSKSATPNQGNDANVCTPGNYCPEGTAQPKPCPAGTFSNATGAVMFSVNCVETFPCLFLPVGKNESNGDALVCLVDHVTFMDLFMYWRFCFVLFCYQYLI